MDFWNTATPNSLAVLMTSLPSCTRSACHSHFFWAGLRFLSRWLADCSSSCGAFVPLASLPMIVVLLVAMFTVHLPNGFSSIKLLAYDASGAHFGPPGYETDLLYLAALLALCFGGAGPFSLDGYVSARRGVDRRDDVEFGAGGRQAERMARRAAPEPAITTTIRKTPRTTDCQ